VKVVRTALRVARVCGGVVERDVVGPINIGLRCLSSNGRPVALASTGVHDVRAMLATPHGGATLLNCLQLIGVV
jgi:transposase